VRKQDEGGVYRKGVEDGGDNIRCRYRRGKVEGDKSKEHQKPARKTGA
jgi:hypothetical protein